MQPHTLTQLLEKDIRGKYVMVRIDANVEYSPDDVIDELENLRLDRALPTLTELRRAGARIILVGHMGRDGSQTLAGVADYFKKKHGLTMTLVSDIFSETAQACVDTLENGNILLFENIRAFPEETANDTTFARKLAAYADYYVNEAFSVCHRQQASVTGVPSIIPGYMGLNTEHEYETLRGVFHNLSTSLICVGGAKFKTKLDLVRHALDAGSWVFVGGALAHTFYKAQGLSIGASLFDDVDVADIAHHARLILPSRVLARGADSEIKEKSISEILDNDIIVDMAPDEAFHLEQGLVDQSFTHILWNGPLGWYEEGYDTGTTALGAWITSQHATTIIGGGDTVYVMQKNNPKILQDFDFVSTGGGALLDLVISGSLPGIEILTGT
ncbi:phosphoglycerate kinase [Candidatus Nomurabacteria bacterium]|nr:phosphoglycerate kinase [Candidatus Nomurabacteria bacterium]